MKEIVIGILGFGQRMNALMRMILSNIHDDPNKKIRVKSLYDIDDRSNENAQFFF